MVPFIAPHGTSWTNETQDGVVSCRVPIKVLGQNRYYAICNHVPYVISY